MERLLPLIIIGIIFSIINSAKNGKKTPPRQGAQARPGAAAPRPAQTARPQPPQARTTTPSPVLAPSDIMPEAVDEGDSRECEHGSVGGSMDIESHEGMSGEFEHAQTKVKTQVKTQVKVNVHTRESADTAAPAADRRRIDRQKLREAVVMAEILKRPSERRVGFR